jgi:hypothetical protein
MRRIGLVAGASVVLASAMAMAQPIFDYVSKEDYFTITFPGQPTVQATTYPTEYRITLPARVHSYQNPRGRYSVTVVDYRDAIKMHEARNEKCRADGGDGDLCQDDGPEEMRGALVYASWNFIKREGVKVTHYAMYNSDLVEGHEIHLLNPDGSNTTAIVHMHEDRLYIIEATVPKGLPLPNWFQISVRFLDKDFQPVRYSWVGSQLYINGYPPPPRANQGRGGGQGPQGGRGRGGQ